MRLWEINLCKKDGTPIAQDELWAYFALLKGMRTNENNNSIQET